MRLKVAEIGELSVRALLAAGTSSKNAKPVAESIAAAEADGIPSHGLIRLLAYCAHAASGKVDGSAVPEVRTVAPGAVAVDARNGFAHPAIELGFEPLIRVTNSCGIGFLAIRNSYNSGVMGLHVEKLAACGFVALGFSNSPATIAPWGGSQPLFGTNPVSMAVRRAGGRVIVVDQAASVIARGEVLLRASRGEPVPEGWGLDRHGQPTTDPARVLDGGSMAPSGGHKGVGLALMVEVLAAALTGARLSAEAGSLTDEKDTKLAGIGHSFIAIDPAPLAGSAFFERIESVCRQIEQQAARVPGDRRLRSRERAEAEGVLVDQHLYERIRALT